MAFTAMQRKLRWQENKRRKDAGMPLLPKKGEAGFDPTWGEVRTGSRATRAAPSDPDKGPALPLTGGGPDTPSGDAPARRGPGRPRTRDRAQMDSTATQAPEAANAAGVGGGNPRKRKGAPAATEADIKLLATQVFGAHQVLAMMSAIPELAISPEEALMLTQQAARTAEAFGLENILQSKWWALASTLGVAGAIYIPRVNHFANRMAADAARAMENRTVDATIVPPSNANGAAPRSTPSATHEPGAEGQDIASGSIAEGMTH